MPNTSPSTAISISTQKPHKTRVTFHRLGYQDLYPNLHLLKLLFQYSGYSLLALVAFVLLYLLAAWCLARIPVSAEENSSPDITVYLRTNGVHTDIIVPVRSQEKDWSPEIRFAHTRSGDSSLSYLAFGWGDKGFYLETPTWADLKVRTAFRAAFGLGSSALHTTFCPQPQENEQCVRLEMSRQQYQRLISYIEHSWQNDSAGAPIPIPTEARYGLHDAFYEAKGNYSLFHTCNTWTNDALKACGQKACWWTPFDKGIFYQYKQEKPLQTHPR